MEAVWINEVVITDLLTPELIDKLDDYIATHGDDRHTIWLDKDTIEDMQETKTITEDEAKILENVLEKTDPNGISIWVGYY